MTYLFVSPERKARLNRLIAAEARRFTARNLPRRSRPTREMTVRELEAMGLPVHRKGEP